MKTFSLPLSVLMFLCACGDVYDGAAGPAPLPGSGALGPAGGGTQAMYQNIPIVDQGAAQRPPQTGAQPPPANTAPTAADTCPNSGTNPATAPSASPAQDGGAAQARSTVREYIRRLMDETRIVPDTAAHKGGPRGSPGSFAKLSPEQVEEFVSAVIDGAKLFLPKSLTDAQRWALVCAEISIESAFTPGTRGINPGDNSKVSVGPLQLTLPQMWDDIFRQYANVPGLTHFNGEAWSPKDTQNDALEHSIYDGVMAALWCITEQGRRGCPDWMGGPDGPMPKTMHTAFLAWVIGGPALKSGGDLAGQRDAYIASIETDLKLLGFDISLVNTAF